MRERGRCRICRGPAPRSRSLCGAAACRERFVAQRVEASRRSKAAQAPPPTPEEIRERCAEIQAEWSRAERESRSCYKHRPAVVPGVDRFGIPGTSPVD